MPLICKLQHKKMILKYFCRYYYDNSFRVSSLEATLGNQAFNPVNITYNLDTGMLERLKTFIFTYTKAAHKITDSNVEIIREYSAANKLTDEWYR